jgi:EmrB/QacA subfamily drug resistance transporter
VTASSDKRAIRAAFAGLMMGALVASLNLTLVAPALPRIVAELGGIQYYSWIPISALIATTVVVPIAGKLSDIYGRKPFYMLGIVVFTLGSILSGLAPSFWFLVGARVVQGIGMGAVQPLSQAIIGDLVPPRERGAYQGLLGAALGVASMIGPVLGGFVTDHFGWRFLFFANVPFALGALAVVWFFMRLPHFSEKRPIDVAGIMTLSGSVTLGLLATVWGGSQYPWLSWQIGTLYGASATLITAFVLIETRVAEPVIPPQLWRSRIFILSNIANMGIATAMFGAIYFLPVFVQGVLAGSVTRSGSVLIPMLLAMIASSILNGQLISRTGRYKPQLVAGVVILGAGFWLLAQMDTGTSNATVVRNMILIGVGLGIAMQTFVLMVQNSVERLMMGTATATTQLFRSIGSALGIAVLGSVLTQSMTAAIPRHLPPSALPPGQGAGSIAGSVLDPSLLAHLSPAIALGIRTALAESLHVVFLTALPFIGVALVATLLIREVALRKTHGTELPAAVAVEAAPEAAAVR